ncbi:hypothetical protein [Persephonella sp.]
MSELAKNNKTVTVKMLKKYLKEKYPNRQTAQIYLKVLENFDENELVPDLILENLLLDEQDFRVDA